MEHCIRRVNTHYRYILYEILLMDLPVYANINLKFHHCLGGSGNVYSFWTRPSQDDNNALIYLFCVVDQTIMSND